MALGGGVDDDAPSPQNLKTTGLMGIIIYATILVINAVTFRNRGKFSPFFLFFFSSLSVVCCFELPRYVLMLIYGKYASQVGYAFHMMASYFFFLCLTMIAHLWSTFVELGRIEAKVYSKVSLFVFNMAFLVVVLVAIVFCVSANSLDTFFDSFTFDVLTIVELVVGLIYSTCLGFLSVKLVIRFHRYANNASSKSNRSVSKDSNDLTDGFKEVMYKVFFSFSMLMLCSIIRLGMLLVKLRNNFLDDFFIENGNFWFLWTDFIPRGVACLTLIYLMFYKPIKLNHLFSRDKDHNSSRNNSNSSGTAGPGGGTGTGGEPGRDPTDLGTLPNSSGGVGARYREDGDIEEERGDTENPIRHRSGTFAGKRSSIELLSGSMAPPLMTEFFRESEDFDMELERAMES